MRWHELHMQASTVRFARLTSGRRRELRLERQRLAVRHLEADSTRRVAPSAPVIVPVMLIGLQLVGLNVNPGRLTFS